MNASNPLSQLRDIHLPQPISNWPPAPGWFILALIILALFGFIAYLIIARYKKTRARRQALMHLNNLQLAYTNKRHAKRAINDLSKLIRRVALASFPRQNVAGLYGQKWLAFLDETGETTAFSDGVGKLLISAPYMKNIPKESDQLFSLAKNWIERNA